MAANAGETKVKLWEGICYPENMRDDWQDESATSVRSHSPDLRSTDTFHFMASPSKPS